MGLFETYPIKLCYFYKIFQSNKPVADMNANVLQVFFHNALKYNFALSLKWGSCAVSPFSVFMFLEVQNECTLCCWFITSMQVCILHAYQSNPSNNCFNLDTCMYADIKLNTSCYTLTEWKLYCFEPEWVLVNYVIRENSRVDGV